MIVYNLFNSLKLNYLFIVPAMLAVASDFSYSQERYVTPPTTTTRGYVPVISDAQMEECVKVYNEITWMNQNLSAARTLDEYNSTVGIINQKTDWFNSNCAGKQSRSACEAANKLNREKGLHVTSCY